MLKRTADIVIACLLGAVLVVPIAVIAALVRLTSRGPALYWSDRIGRDNRLFPMPKFRSMRTETPEVATHLLAGSDQWITPLGRFLRKTSLDELPQLYSVLVGDMSLVGPRPALHNQDDLRDLRTQHGVHRLRPGVTGWAQINGRDELSIPEKVGFDVEYLQRQSLWFDLKILALTAIRVVRSDGVKQADTIALPTTSAPSVGVRRDAA